MEEYRGGRGVGRPRQRPVLGFLFFEEYRGGGGRYLIAHVNVKGLKLSLSLYYCSSSLLIAFTRVSGLGNTIRDTCCTPGADLEFRVKLKD